jgi:hypothetical protein
VVLLPCSPCCGGVAIGCLNGCSVPDSFTVNVTASDYVRKLIGKVQSSRVEPGGSPSPAYPVGLGVGFTQHWTGDAIAGTHTMLPVAAYKFELSLPNFLLIFYNDRCELNIYTIGYALAHLPGGSFVSGVAQATTPPTLAEVAAAAAAWPSPADPYPRNAPFPYSCEHILNTGTRDVMPLRTDGGPGDGDPNRADGVGMGYLNGPTFFVDFEVRVAELYKYDTRVPSPPDQPNPDYPGHYITAASSDYAIPPDIVEETGDRHVRIEITPVYNPLP